MACARRDTEPPLPRGWRSGAQLPSMGADLQDGVAGGAAPRRAVGPTVNWGNDRTSEPSRAARSFSRLSFCSGSVLGHMYSSGSNFGLESNLKLGPTSHIKSTDIMFKLK